MNKCYSTNEEEYSFTSLEEAAEYIWDLDQATVGDVTTVWEGDVVELFASNFSPYMAEYLTQRAYDEHGEFSESWKFSREEEKSLQDVVDEAVDKWATEHNMHPKFYSVKNVTPITIKFINEEGEFEVFEI